MPMRLQATPTRILRSLALVSAGALAGLFAVFDASADPPKDGQAGVEGTVVHVRGTCPNLTFSVGDREISAQEQTKYEHGFCRDVEAGRKVEVTGKLDAEGKMTANMIELAEQD